MKNIKIVMLTCFLSLCLVNLAGCSSSAAGAAIDGASQKDFSVLDKGTPRDLVAGELGQPVRSEAQSDLFSVLAGQNGFLKATKAVGYTVLAVGTLGLSELITSPFERATSKGAKMVIKVFYDKENRVDHVQALKDDRWFPIQSLGDADSNQNTSQNKQVVSKKEPVEQVKSKIERATADEMNSISAHEQSVVSPKSKA